MVALHPEGVDRNSIYEVLPAILEVALHPEGVDRNGAGSFLHRLVPLSPSTRRAWIEIDQCCKWQHPFGVALHPEGVDRNAKDRAQCTWAFVALHPEGVDRNWGNPVESWKEG